MSTPRVTPTRTRFQLQRAGVLNVWQYDEQVFEFGEGRLLLRGTNGAGKSKTLELLLPFCIDGDRQRMNATGRAQTPLTWLMLDGIDDKLRTGYVWVEFERTDDDGHLHHVTCGVGLRASRTSSSVTTWMFCTPQRVGVDLQLEDADGPLSSPALKAAVAPAGRHFEVARDFRAHVGQVLFGLDPSRYDDLLRLLYWLRQPQIGEEIDPKRIAVQLVQSLPELDDDELTRAGQTLDELADFGEKLRRTEAARAAVAVAMEVYARYARSVTRDRAQRLVRTDQDRRRIQRTVRQHERDLAQLKAAVEQLHGEQESTTATQRAARAELDALSINPDEARLDDARARAVSAENSATSQRKAVDRAVLALASAETANTAAARSAEQTARRLDDDIRAIAELARTTQTQLPSGFAGARGASSVLTYTSDAGVEGAETWANGHVAALDTLNQLVAVRTAALVAARTRAREHERMHETAAATTQAAEAAAVRADEIRLRVTGLHESASSLAQRWREALTTWAAATSAIPVDVVETARDFDVDDLLDDPSIDDLQEKVAGQTAAEIAMRRQLERQLDVDRAAAARALGETQTALDAAREESDPAPPALPLPRDRDGDTARPGRPLWRALDFADHLPGASRAAVEAALQQCGLLDAWIDPAGALRDDVFEVVANASRPVEGPSLANVLKSSDGDDRVGELLASISLLERADLAPDGVVAVGLDGTFRLGLLQGRAHKPSAQYIGAPARVAERARRIDELLAQVSAHTRHVEELRRLQVAAAADVLALETWISSVPPTREFVRARDRLDDARRALVDGEARARTADDVAVAARARAAKALNELQDWAHTHGLPTDLPALDQLRDDLHDLGGTLIRHRDAIGSLVATVVDLAAAGARVSQAAAAKTEAEYEGNAARDEAMALQHAFESLSDALSESLGQLASRRQSAQRRLTDAETRLGEVGELISDRRELLAVGTERLSQVVHEAVRHTADERTAAEELCRLRDVPGLLAAALGELDESQDRHLAAGASAPEDEPAPQPLLELASDWSRLNGGTGPADANAVLRVHSELATGEAASHEPALSDVDGTYAIIARDGGAQLTLAQLATALTDRVRQQTELLTSRERDAFEQVLLGSLGDELRRRLQEAHELVTGMNELLQSIRTSQGIRVKLRWHVRDDAPPEARDVTALVARSSSTLLPDERLRLHTAMGQLLALAADDAPDDGYAEHLRRALDYRTWYEFTVQYSRPGSDAWLDLSRRSPLSQGEQKVACYLPLFAAAAAHFTSVAGAAPHAPRFVLLDDAFPKIDARTHPLLFGLLVQLDLDFVITSERLWGDHPELPSLAIYEALRNPGEPGIAQAHYTWDGRALQAVGMP